MKNVNLTALAFWISYIGLYVSVVLIILDRL